MRTPGVDGGRREVNIEVDRVQSGESTVTRNPDEEGYAEFWRERANDHGRIDASQPDVADTDETDEAGEIGETDET